MFSTSRSVSSIRRSTTLRRAAVLSLGAGLLGATAAPATAAPTTASTSFPATRASAPAAASTRTATAAARLVSRADVDGDGRADRTTIARTTAHGDPAWRLTTRTARGRSSSVVVETPWLFGEPAWYGAAALDGAPGAELVVRSGFGAHTAMFRMFSWRGGRLVAQADPSTGDAEWSTDGALSVSKGYRFTTRRGVTTLTASIYERDFSRNPNVMDGTVRTYTWRSGAWRATSVRTGRVLDSSPHVANAYGWNAAGLPRD